MSGVLFGIFMHVLLQAHWESADSCRTGHSSGRFEMHVLQLLRIWVFVKGKFSTQSGSFQVQKRLP